MTITPILKNCSDDVCVLSAIGTAAVINTQFTMYETNKPDTDRENSKDSKRMSFCSQKGFDSDTETVIGQVPTGCSLCHIPHSKFTLPVNGKMKKCAVCK